ncbi:MAG: lysophospholipid acyltransferase family protein [Thermoanaerobaculia bacterium]
MTPIRLLVRSGKALWWFIRAGLLTIREIPRTGVDYDLTHRYASRLSSGWKRIFRIAHEVRNRERLLANQPCVYVANHRSNLDVITLCEILPAQTLVIGKQELRKIPFLGRIFVGGGNIPINRKDADAARQAIERAEKIVREQDLSIFIFPEGTRDYGRLLPFKKGAFHLARNAGVVIQPMVCAATDRWMRGGRLWLAPSVDVLIEVLEPIDPNAFESVDTMIVETRRRMAAALESLEREIIERERKESARVVNAE